MATNEIVTQASKRTVTTIGTFDWAERAYGDLTPEKLTELTCLLAGTRRAAAPEESIQGLINRAINIWNAAHEALCLTEHQKRAFQQWRMTGVEDGQISFNEIAKQKLLPSRRGDAAAIESENGVKKIVRKYFQTLLDGIKEVYAKSWIKETERQELKKRLVLLQEHSLANGKIPIRVVDILKKYQQNLRHKGSHSPDSEEFELVLGGKFYFSSIYELLDSVH